jgi:hypothetical protein
MDRALDAMLKNRFLWNDYKIQINFAGQLSAAEQNMNRSVDRSTFTEQISAAFLLDHYHKI